MTTQTDDDLIAIATDLIDRVTDGENYTVAAAIRTTDGRIITGINLYHFTGGPCAELVALANAAAAAATVETIVAIGSNGQGVIPPCGRCRQVLVEYWPAAEVIMPGVDGGEPSATPIATLLPHSYGRPAVTDV